MKGNAKIYLGLKEIALSTNAATALCYNEIG